MSGPDLMTPREVSAALGLDPQTIARYARAGKLACVRPGAHRRYFRAEVEAIRRGQPLTPEQVGALRDQWTGPVS